MRRRTWLPVVATLTGIVVLSGGAVAQESPAPAEAASPSVIAWPGTRASPAGVRAWYPGQSRNWMHKVPDDGSAVELTFEIDPREPFELPLRPAAVRAQVWLIDLDGQTAVITVLSKSGTPPALVAEAEAIVETIRVDLDGPGGPRLLFDLTEGWDVG